mmetsp:Transcript_22012/g.48995  ORF Transcript_22012/g.48995 Transcript_22012/m.48995 type:complete len:262 (+) Transcript_22012:1239-2024(+)
MRRIPALQNAQRPAASLLMKAQVPYVVVARNSVWILTMRHVPCRFAVAQAATGKAVSSARRSPILLMQTSLPPRRPHRLCSPVNSRLLLFPLPSRLEKNTSSHTATTDEPCDQRSAPNGAATTHLRNRWRYVAAPGQREQSSMRPARVAIGHPRRRRRARQRRTLRVGASRIQVALQSRKRRTTTSRASGRQTASRALSSTAPCASISTRSSSAVSVPVGSASTSTRKNIPSFAIDVIRSIILSALVYLVSPRVTGSAQPA